MFKIFLFISFLTLFNCDAKEPKAELGLGMFALSYPSYIGSKTTNILIGPYPHIRYRGDILTADKDGFAGKFLTLYGIRMDLSFGGSLPSNSEDSNVRNGMENFDFSGEVGLKLVYSVYKKLHHEFELDVHTRAVISTDFSSLKYRGLVGNAGIKYTYDYKKFELILRTGIVFANERYNNYFYGVKEQYVTNTRAYYKADAGYNGLRNSIGISYQQNAWWLGAYISHFNINNAVVVDSPLVETKDATYMGVSFAYIFYTQD